MKFILQESLNENKKFLLDERFRLTEAETLTEASAESVAVSWSQKFKAVADTTQAVLKKYIEFAGLTKSTATQRTQLKDLKSAVESSASELENTMDLPPEELKADNFNSAKTELKSYTDALIQIQKTIKPKAETADVFTLLATRIKNLNILRTRFGQWKSQDSDAVKQILQWVTEKVLPILDTTALDSDAAAVDTFKQTCNECLGLLKELKADLPMSAESFTDLQPTELKDYCVAIRQAVEAIELPDATKINRGIIIANLKKYQAQVQALKNAYTQIKETAVLTKQIATKDKATAALDRTFAGLNEKDWKVKYAEAVNKEAVIKEFIYTVWNTTSEAAKVMQIKDAIAQECESFGFKPSDEAGKNGNPFIKFVSEVYLKYNMRADAYKAIHNLVANNYIKASDLVGAENANGLGKSNIIFCKALYKLEAPVIKLYIKKQASLLKAVQKPDIFKSIPEMVFNMLYKLPEIVTGSLKESTDLEINSLTAIEELEAKWIGAVSDTPLDPNDKPTKTSIATNAEIINQIKTSENAVKVLATLAIKFSSNDDIVNAVEVCKEAKQLMNKTTTFAEIQKLIASVERLYKIDKITATQALSLVKSILDSNQFTLTVG